MPFFTSGGQLLADMVTSRRCTLFGDTKCPGLGVQGPAANWRCETRPRAGFVYRHRKKKTSEIIEDKGGAGRDEAQKAVLEMARAEFFAAAGKMVFLEGVSLEGVKDPKGGIIGRSFWVVLRLR